MLSSHSESRDKCGCLFQGGMPSVDFKKVALFMLCISPVRRLISFVVATVVVNMEAWKAPNITSLQSSVTTSGVFWRSVIFWWPVLKMSRQTLHKFISFFFLFLVI